MRKKNKFGPFRPVLNKPEDRERSIKENSPALFEIEKNFPINLNKPLVDYISDDLYNSEFFGRKAVQSNDKLILKNAQKHNLDPDIVRSVMFAENARGHKFGFNKVVEDIGYADSLLPMNIQKDRWSSLIGKQPDDLYDADSNIETATILLKRISDRVNKPTPEKIG